MWVRWRISKGNGIGAMSNPTAIKHIRDATRREVVEAFLRVELERAQYISLREEFRELSQKSDAEFFPRVRRFADQRSDTNPFLVFTVGVRGDERWRQVKKWELIECPIGELYTLGINPRMKEDLQTVGWNLQKFVEVGHARGYPEFRLNEMPPSDLTTLFGLRRQERGKIGSIAIIDGSHRAVSMAAQNIETTTVYVANF